MMLNKVAVYRRLAHMQPWPIATYVSFRPAAVLLVPVYAEPAFAWLWRFGSGTGPLGYNSGISSSDTCSLSITIRYMFDE